MARFRKLQPLSTLGVILDSPEMAGIVSGIAQEIAGNISDSNAAFMASVRTQTFRTTSGRGVRRVVGQVGAAPGVGSRVEAKRGPIARALGASGG